MKILIVMGGFFPGKKFGGPPVSVDNFCSLMRGQHECYLVTHNHDMGDKTPYEETCEEWVDRGNVKVKYLSDEDYGYSTFLCVVRVIRPDYIYLQSLFQNCVIPCLMIARKEKVKVMLAPRGELCTGAFKKKYKKLPYIWFLRTMGLVRDAQFQSTSDEETEAIKKYLGASNAQIHYLTNIPSIPSGLTERDKKMAGTARFVFISRILWKKNLLSAIRFFKGVEGNVIFDIYGPKEDANYWTECEKVIDELPQNVKVSYKGMLSHDEIHRTFNKYDAFLFPTLSENFGHVIAEALLTKCIPIISDQTPWTDMNEAGAGWALPLKEEDAFRKAIQDVVAMNNEDILAKRKNIVAYTERKLKIELLKEAYQQAFGWQAEKHHVDGC